MEKETKPTRSVPAYWELEDGVFVTYQKVLDDPEIRARVIRKLVADHDFERLEELKKSLG